MSLREQFVTLALLPGANRRALCRLFGISPDTAYRLLQRYEVEGYPGLTGRSRRPHTSPTRTRADIEAAIVDLRGVHPTWGGRKIAARLRALGMTPVPAPSTVTAILRRHQLLDPERAGQPRAFTRFEHDRPNRLWQMDFKGHVACDSGGRCHPLTMLDDHSRYNIALVACPDERRSTVRQALETAFRTYGLPDAMLADNGPPWGDPTGGPYTRLGVWLLQLGVRLLHSRPHHPQTLGKEERFHRTLKAEVLCRPLADLADGQRRFDAWRQVYNHERPHEALALQPPASRYRPSTRVFPERLPPLEYLSADIVRQVQRDGRVRLHGRVLQLSRAFSGYPVAFRPADVDGCFDAYFATVPIARVDLRGAS